jgi:hypothetical protein
MWEGGGGGSHTLHIHPTQKGFGYLKWIIIEENRVERKRNSSYIYGIKCGVWSGK